MFNLNWTLKWKVLTGVTLTSTLAVVVSTAIFVALELNRLDRTIDTQAQTTARLIGANTTGALAFLDSTSATETLGALQLNNSIMASVLFDDSGSEFARFTTNNSGGALPQRPGANQVIHRPQLGYIELFEPVSMDGDVIGTLYLRVSLQERERLVATYITSFILIVLGVTVMALAISLLVQRSIVKPVVEVVNALRDMAEGDGDLTQRIRVSSKDEVGELAHWFNVFAERIQTVIGRFKDSAQNLTIASSQLSSTITRTAEGAMRQQNEIEHVAKAMSEMAGTVEEVARNVSMSANDAQKADEESAKGANVVTQTMGAINALARDIDQASEVITDLQKETDNIGSVLDVIRGIAEQTNLLALNAAIEAARAGEQGRGFAVVADEVRTLASRTQASTEEIQVMIHKLQSGANQAVQVMVKGRDQAASSVDHASRAGQSLQTITRAVSVIKDMSNQIASASEEQSAVTIEINRNINNISEVANETANGSREISKGATELARLASEMQALVAQFKCA
ncbi:MAG: methyl-accepting chemotaxis protein [Pseudohongiella sp.]|nr:methyl-accepting chemotaxis protein [Pseudohongiella sp.]MDO9518762.1 methyl-accepting chemotaxis protein [Pseudohongiella sp.]MDP2126416.1 methyl-accepting chemotaxis protein [Pseudohongiella sp.]